MSNLLISMYYTKRKELINQFEEIEQSIKTQKSEFYISKLRSKQIEIMEDITAINEILQKTIES